jgi:hypothetical protein
MWGNNCRKKLDQARSFARSNWIFLLILAVGLVFRLSALNNALSFDEYTQTRAVLQANEWGFEKFSEMNPLTNWTRILVTYFLGVHIWSMRLTSLIFAIATAWILYLLAKELYNKKAALFAVALLWLSAWHSLVSTSVSFDGTFMTFYTLLTMYFFVKHEKTEERKWLYFCGIAFGLTVLTKYPGVLIFPALFIYSLIMHRDIKRAFKEFFIIGIVGVAVFSIFPIIVFLFTDPGFFWTAFQHGNPYFSDRTISPVLLAIQYAHALFWMGPLMFFGYFLSWSGRQKQDWLSHTFIFVVLVFYTFIDRDPFRPVERYFVVFLPLLCMLIGKYLVDLRINKRLWKTCGITFAVFLALNFILALLPWEFLPFYPKTNFVNAVFSWDWNFFVPFTGDQGPVGLYVKFLLFAIALIAGAVFFALSFRKKALGSVLLVAVGLALSVFVMSELAWHLNSPDISKVTKETVSYVFDQNLQGPYYFFRDDAMRYYFNHSAVKIDFDAEGRADEIAASLNKGGTLIMVDFPTLDKNSRLWKAFNQCKLRKTIIDRDQPFGYVFSC